MRSTSLISVACAACVAALFLRTARADDVEAVQRRMSDYYVSTIATSMVDGWLAAQKADGSFADIDYTSKARTNWEPLPHLQRLKAMAVAYRTPGGAHFANSKVLAAIDRGLNVWYAKKPVSDNWWYNDIGKQLELGPLGVLLEGALSSTQLSRITQDLAKAPNLTGENRVWISQETVQRGCLENSAARVSAGLAGITETVLVTLAEGVQQDFSFHQHGPQLYSGGYGLGFLKDATFWASMTAGTSFAFSEEQVNVLVSLALDGDRWMIRGRMFDQSAKGREISRPDGSSVNVAVAADQLAQLAPDRAAELHALSAYVMNGGAPVVSGNRYFFRSDFMAHQRPGLYVSVKMSSTRTTGTESMNGENLLGYWLPFGLTYIAPDGDEYTNVFPLWDWGRLPGVTSPHAATKPDGKHDSSLVGGVSDGLSGVAAMHLDKSSTTAEKAWFALGDVVVALGAAVTSTHAQPVGTTLDQRLLAGPVTSSKGVAGGGEQTLEDVTWLHHDKVGFLFFEPSTVRLKTGKTTGSWRTISTAQKTDSVSADTFTAWLDHGTKPSNAAYAYAIVPATNPTLLGTLAAAPPVTLLANDAVAQAVRHEQLAVTGVVFHSAGKLRTGALQVTVDQPVFLLIDERAGRVTAASLDASAFTVNVAIMRDDGVFAQTSLTLPDGEAVRGSSVSADVEELKSSVDSDGGLGDGGEVDLADAGVVQPPDGLMPPDAGSTGTLDGGTDHATDAGNSKPSMSSPHSHGGCSVQSTSGCQSAGATSFLLLVFMARWRARTRRCRGQSGPRS